MLVESRSFVSRVNDQVRKRQKRISNVAEDGEKHSIICGMFMTVTMESALVRFSTTSNRTMHGNKDWDGSNHLRFTEILTESTVSQWNSSGILPRTQYVAAQ